MKTGSEYKVRVRARSAVGAGKWSKEHTQKSGSELCALYYSMLKVYISLCISLSVPLHVYFMCSSATSYVLTIGLYVWDEPGLRFIFYYATASMAA